MNSSYDAIIIGAGMSGLAAGIRLAMFNKKVCILEKHSISGGLNSYYQRGKRLFDVGLHAMTNYCPRGEKHRPLTKLLKQLRLPYEALELKEQNHSKIIFPDSTLHFNNEIDFFLSEIERTFPHQVDAFLKLLEVIKAHNELDLNQEFLSAKEVVSRIIPDPTLVEMIFCPLLIYGSAWEDDMDFSQFVIMFKSIFLEGFAKPQGGVRKILNLLLEKFQSLGGELYFRKEVSAIQWGKGKLQGVHLKSGEFLETTCLLSSIGYPETLRLCHPSPSVYPRVGNLSFTECLLVFDRLPKQDQIDSTIVFYNNRPTYHYRKPDALFDPESAVICLPDNFGREQSEFSQAELSGEGMIRFTHIANFDHWNALSREEYKAQKEEVLKNALRLTSLHFPSFQGKLVFHDVFTPKTILKYTGHSQGVVYGSPDKTRNGKTPIEGLYICGTDQGFLGIVGSMLSGISMANLYGLMN